MDAKNKTPGTLTRAPGAEETAADGRSLHPNDAAAQRTRILAALREGPLTTLDARKHLDVLHPAMRVLELRRRGEPIATVWTLQATDCGQVHRIARYVLQCVLAGELA